MRCFRRTGVGISLGSTWRIFFNRALHHTTALSGTAPDYSRAVSSTRQVPFLTPESTWQIPTIFFVTTTNNKIMAHNNRATARTCGDMSTARTAVHNRRYSTQPPRAEKTHTNPMGLSQKHNFGGNHDFVFTRQNRADTPVSRPSPSVKYFEYFELEN